MLNRFFIFALILLGSFSVCFAQNINLYDQPKSDAKVVGTIDSAAGMVPIFTTKNGDWMKVGDPRNGNVGWVKTIDFSNGNSGFSFTQHVIDTGKGPQQYILQLGIPKPLTQEQSAAIIKQIQQQQADMQKNFQLLMQQFYGAWPATAPQQAKPQEKTGK